MCDELKQLQLDPEIQRKISKYTYKLKNKYAVQNLLSACVLNSMYPASYQITISWKLRQKSSSFTAWMSLENMMLDFLSGTVDRNPPANAGDTGSVPGLGGFHMPQSN